MAMTDLVSRKWREERNFGGMMREGDAWEKRQSIGKVVGCGASGRLGGPPWGRERPEEAAAASSWRRLMAEVAIPSWLGLW